MKNKVWGWHVRLDASGCNLFAITDYDTVYKFTKQLVKEIDMVAYGEPQIIDFGTGDKAGFTLVQLIETSNICAHFSNELEAIFLDVFSCKDFDEDTVCRLMDEYFNPASIYSRKEERTCYVES